MFLRTALCVLCLFSLSSSVSCKSECARRCGQDKLELTGYECPEIADKCCAARTRSNVPYLVVSVCGIAALLLFWLLYAHCMTDPKLNLHKYVWPHDAGSSPLPFRDLKFQEQAQFVNQDEKTIATYHSPPRFRAGNALLDPTSPRAVLLFVPPPGSHMQRYSIVADVASGLGYSTHGLDLQGFGNSGGGGRKGTSGVVNDFEELVRDVLDYAGRIKERYPDRLLFILGHGLGATIAALCAHRDPHLFAGAVYVAPIFNPFWTKFQQALIRKLGGQFPNLRLRAVCWPAPDITSPNKAMEEHNLEDPLYSKGPIPLGTALQILKLMEAACECVPETTTNLLLQQGGRDLVSFGAAKHLAKSRAIIKDNFITKDEWHDLLGGYHAHEIVSNILDWVQDRVQAVFLASTLD